MINESRKRHGEKSMTWKEFMDDDQENKVGRPLRKPAEAPIPRKRKDGTYVHEDYVEPDPPKQNQRPKAEYSNKSAREKYGL